MQTRTVLRFALLIICLPFGLATSHAADSTDGALASIRADDISQHVKELASDEYQGRMPGTRGEEKTLAYITKQLRAYGIAPQPGGSYLQDVPLVKKTPQPGTHLRRLHEGGYHHPSDEYRDDWDLRGIVGDVKIYFLTGYALANETRFPNWYADSEFRPIRDRQRAAP